MRIDIDKEFADIDSMSKEEVITEIKSFFKGNKKFIDKAIVLIYSTRNFKKIISLRYQTDNFDWEKYMSINIDAEQGWKMLLYRKGNKKYAATADGRGNKTSDIDEFSIASHARGSSIIEEYKF